MREEYRTIDVLRRERETELVDLRKKLNAGDFTAAEQVAHIGPHNSTGVDSQPFLHTA